MTVSGTIEGVSGGEIIGCCFSVASSWWWWWWWPWWSCRWTVDIGCVQPKSHPSPWAQPFVRVLCVISFQLILELVLFECCWRWCWRWWWWWFNLLNRNKIAQTRNIINITLCQTSMDNVCYTTFRSPHQIGKEEKVAFCWFEHFGWFAWPTVSSNRVIWLTNRNDRQKMVKSMILMWSNMIRTTIWLTANPCGIVHLGEDDISRIIQMNKYPQKNLTYLREFGISLPKHIRHRS